MFTKEDRSTFPYWFAHWCAFQMTVLNLKAWKFKYLFHDIEKPFLKLFLPYSKVQKLHRRNHNHHPEWLEERLRKLEKHGTNNLYKLYRLFEKYDFEATAIDWECSHFTKEAAKLDAYEEFNRFVSDESFKEKYPLINKYLPQSFPYMFLRALDKLGIGARAHFWQRVKN